MICCTVPVFLSSVLLFGIVVDGFIVSSQLQFCSARSITSDRKLCPNDDECDNEKLNIYNENNQFERNNRREFFISSFAVSVITSQIRGDVANAAENFSGSLNTILIEIQKARQQMNAVPDLIKSEQWDGVRAILITPPLSDLWTKSARKSSLLQDYANVIGTSPTGDELAVLEAKEDVEGHLRFLDMAVYNNNFNPIKSVGEIGATKALISSYYEDPINEYKATVAALDNLIQLGDVK